MAWKYKRLMPKVLGFKQKLLTIQDLLGLLGRSLEEIVGVLQTSPYNAVIAAIPEKPVDAAALERALREDYIRTLEAIVDASPKDIQRLLTTIRSKFEVHNIKALLRAKRAKLNVDEAMRYVIPIGRLDDSSCREVYRHAGSYADILPLLADSGYPLLPDEDDTVDEMFVLEASLDRDVNRIGMEIASATLKTMLRSKALGISKEYVLRHVQPAAGFSQEDYEAAFDQVDLRSTIELLGKTADKASRDIRYLLQDLSRECDAFPPLSRVEAVFDRNLLTASQRMLKRYTPFFNVGLVLAFLNAKWFEVRNLSTIARGAVDELPPDRVTELLILPGI
jgi:vacuolar-type H+-ATPase subunit C/Vma6